MQIKKYSNSKVEVTILELETKDGKVYKVTKRVPELSVADTKIFKSKKEAVLQAQEWLQ